MPYQIGLAIGAFGRMFIANPDLPQRIRAGVPLNAFDRSTAYGGGAHGYSCSPLLAPLAKAAGPFFLRRTQGIVG